MIALPFVRVYSVPYVSWEQINAYFDKTDLPGPRAPERRRALLQYIAEHNTVPAEYEDLYAEIGRRWWDMNSIGDHTAEEYLLVYYAHRHHQVKRHFTADFWRETDRREGTFYRLISYMPWEAVRTDRIMRLQIVVALVRSGGLQDKNAEAIAEWFAQWDNRPGSLADELWWGWDIVHIMHERSMCVNRLHNVGRAIEKWYTEHGTLPETLEELVGTHLDRLPVHFFTKEPMEYHRNAPPPQDVERGSGTLSVHILRRDRTYSVSTTWQQALDAFLESGGTYLRLGRWVLVIAGEGEGSQE